MYRDRTRNPDFNPYASRSDGKPDNTSGVLAGDHTNARANSDGSQADRLLHGRCNSQRGDGSHDHERPALRFTAPSSLGDLAMGWPSQSDY
jgi:hypothetical protein